jgi:enoyl-CoA hydratase
MVCQIRHGHDFFEGIRAQLIDKDRNPKWHPAAFEAVSDADIAAYLEPPASGDLTFE